LTDIDLVLSKYTPELQNYLKSILDSYIKSDCADDDSYSRLCEPSRQHFFAKVWEAILYKRFYDLGWSIQGLQNGGPDFLLNGTTCDKQVYVEATVPAPEGLPENWLNSESGGMTTFPYAEMLLRWTSSLKAKSDKHRRDMQKPHIDANRPFVIAINSCRLSRMADDFGISQWPFAVEAVFPVGCITVPINRNTGEMGEAFQGQRFTILKPKTNKNIPTDNFLNPDYSHVSALLGCSSCWASLNNRDDPVKLPTMFLVHNPLANNPLPQGWLPGAIEYVTTKKSENEYLLKELNEVD